MQLIRRFEPLPSSEQTPCFVFETSVFHLSDVSDLINKYVNITYEQ